MHVRFGENVKNELHRLILSTIGIIMLGTAINLLSWKYKLVSGGFPGYALNINYLTGFPVGKSLLIANTAVLILSLLVAGKTAGLRGIYGYTFLSVFIEVSKGLLNLQQIETSLIFTNLLLTSLQGFIAPIGIALVIVSGYSFGSYSSVIPIIDRFKKIPAPVTFLFFDLILAVLTLYFFGFEKAIFMLVNALVFYLTFNQTLKVLNKSRLHIRNRN